jgi:transcriptional regulator with XRE-family HTH domain
MERNKQVYLETIDNYIQIISELPMFLENADDTIYEIANKIGISFSTLSNKKHGRRNWKYEEVNKLMQLLGNEKQRTVVKNYILVVNDILPIIQENGIRFSFIFEKAGMTVGNYQVRSKGAANGSISAWDVAEVRKIIDVLKF